MKVTLGKFARAGIEFHSGRDLAAGIQTALTHYAKGSSERASVPAPRFLRDLLSCEQADLIELTVTPTMHARLELEARRHSVSVEELAAHAVLVYLADLDEPALRQAG